MSTCPVSGGCRFHSIVESSLAKRVRFASAFPYCKGGRHESCELLPYVLDHREAPRDLLPDGSRGDYDGEHGQASVPGRVSLSRRMLVVEDSPVFATLAANAIRQHMPEASVEVCTDFTEAEAVIRTKGAHAVVSGYGIGNGRTVHDIRNITTAPILIFTGRLGDDIELPSRSRVVRKDAGPEALCSSLDALLAT